VKRLIWTAICRPKLSWMLHHELHAQCKASKAELIRRLRADDPCWVGPWVRLERRPMFDKRKFRRGLAIVCKPQQLDG
jgi:hypothetical protein